MGPNDHTDELVLSFLADSLPDFVQGEVLSGKLGIPRAAVFWGVERLREQGYRIDSSPARGFRLVEIPDRLTRLELAPLLATHDLGCRIHSHEELASTNETALELARAGALHGEVVVAEGQTAGKGRRGRSWASPPGLNLHLSVVLRPELSPARAPELTFVAAVATCETLHEAGVPARIKWPNDLEVDGRKVAGILTELVADPDRTRFAVLGIGVNLNCGPEDLPEELRSIATSARVVRGERVPRALFTAALLARLEEWLERHEEEGFGPVRERWRELASTLGSDVRVETGAAPLEGEAFDVDDSGALLLRADDGQTLRVVAGDVTTLRRRNQ